MKCHAGIEFPSGKPCPKCNAKLGEVCWPGINADLLELARLRVENEQLRSGVAQISGDADEVTRLRAELDEVSADYFAECDKVKGLELKLAAHAQASRNAVIDECVKAAFSVRYGSPSSRHDKKPKGWHLPRDCTPTDAAMHDNGCIDAAKAIRALSTLSSTNRVGLLDPGIDGPYNEPCEHKSVHDGPRVEARWGTVPTQVCDCGAWRTMHHKPGPWQTSPVTSTDRGST